MGVCCTYLSTDKKVSAIFTDSRHMEAKKLFYVLYVDKRNLVVICLKFLFIVVGYLRPTIALSSFLILFAFSPLHCAALPRK